MDMQVDYGKYMKTRRFDQESHSDWAIGGQRRLYIITQPLAKTKSTPPGGADRGLDGGSGRSVSVE